ncbi:MAG: hypothetical protein V7607_1491 [Solirubrobacteraceae bacterium]
MPAPPRTEGIARAYARDFDDLWRRGRVLAGVAGGRYFIVACVDATHRVWERNERNNCRVSSRRLAVAGRNGAASGSSPPTASSADGDHDGYAAKAVFVSPTGNDASPADYIVDGP